MPQPNAAPRSRRADARLNEERILETARRLLAQSPGATLTDVAAAAGVSRSTIYRSFATREQLVAAAREGSSERDAGAGEEVLPAGRLGRDRPVSLEAIQVFDVVAPSVLPQQLVAEAERIAEVPVALYVIDIDGSHLLRVAGAEQLPESFEAPLAIGPEIDADGLAQVRGRLAQHPGSELVPLWLRGRAIGMMLTVGPPRRSLAEMARQAAAAITLADRYSDTFARTQRRKQPVAAAEIQQSLLPPRIMRISGGEVAGNVLPSYEVAGDWFDVTENADGVWVALADGLGGATRAAASSAVALGALRASRRSGGSVGEALMVMHQTLREMPGPRAEMTALATHWNIATQTLSSHNCGHTFPIVIRADGTVETIESEAGHGLGGRASPRPAIESTRLGSGDRLVLYSDGVAHHGEGKAGLGMNGVAEAALTSDRASAADTVRAVHTEVLARAEGELDDDATVVCLALA